MMGRAGTIGLLTAALAVLWGCGEAPPAGDAATGGAAAPQAAGEDAAEAMFAETCLNLTGSQSICACVRDRVAEASGPQGLAYIGAAYGGTPEEVAPYEAAMSQAERNTAAEAFLDGQFDCVIAQDPDYAPDAAPDAGQATLGVDQPESLFEQAVTVCVDAGAGPEPVCRCRVQSVFDALGQDGLTLATAAEAGDEEALRALAAAHGQDWLVQGRAALEDARAECAP